MYKRSLSLLLVLVCLALATACNKDDQVNSFVNDLNSFTDGIVKSADGAPNPSAAMDEAQKYFDSNKADMLSKAQKLKNVSSYQVSSDSKKKLEEAGLNNVTKIKNLGEKYGNDPEAAPKFQKLAQDYASMLQDIAKS